MNREERKRFIIERARELFARYGMKKTTMGDIASTCGMGKASLYYYFRSKEDIFRAVIRMEFEIFKRKAEESLSKAKSPQDKIRAYIWTRSTVLRKMANYYETFTSEYLEHYGFVERERQRLTDWEIETMRSILEEGVRQGVFEISDTKLTAVVLVFALKGLEFPWMVEQDIIELEHAIDLLLPVLFRGIEKR
ncbi:TetR/AcrR family transcriptional regulator [Candidatus Poribacteria bacterium]|nr:TetR/AcrR family transcriptional regulator [Candidatus Poribacteria bacterium]